MNKTTKKLKQIEKELAIRLNEDFGGLKKWVFFGDMSGGHLTIVITAREKK